MFLKALAFGVELVEFRFAKHEQLSTVAVRQEECIGAGRSSSASVAWAGKSRDAPNNAASPMGRKSTMADRGDGLSKHQIGVFDGG